MICFLFYNIAGGIVHQIRREKRTTISEVIVRGKRNAKWSEANRDGADAESPFPLFFSFSASFKNSSPREKVGKLASFWDWWAESLFVSIIVAKYIISPRANNGRLRQKKKFRRSDLLTLSACTIGILSTVTYTEFDCAALLAML